MVVAFSSPVLRARATLTAHQDEDIDNTSIDQSSFVAGQLADVGGVEKKREHMELLSSVWLLFCAAYLSDILLDAYLTPNPVSSSSTGRCLRILDKNLRTN
jgi:hypothetical protein